MKSDITLAELKENRKKIIYSFNFGTKFLGLFSSYISYFLIKFTKITGNQVTLFWAALEVLGIMLVASGRYNLVLIGILLAHIAMMLDLVDGDIARARNKRTIGGIYLDDIAQILHRSLLLAAVGIGLFNQGESLLFLYLGLFSALIFMFTSSIELKMKNMLLERGLFKNNSKTKSGQKELRIWKITSYFRLAEPFNVVYIALILNIIFVVKSLLIAYTFVILASFFKKFYSLYRENGNTLNNH